MYIHNPVWDPAGLRIAFTGQELDASGYADSGKNIYQVDVITGSIIPLTDSSPGTPGCSSPSWSPGGDELVFVCRGGMAAGLVISRPDGSDTWFYEAGQVDAVTWLPAGDNLAFRGAWHPLGVIDVAFMRSRDPEGNPNYRNLYAILESLPFQEKPIIAYAWSPTRDDLFLVQSSDLIQVVDLSQQEVLSIQGDFKGLEGQFSWGPETKQIAFAFSDGDDAEIGTVHLEQKTFTRVTANDTDDLMPAWQPGP